MINNQISNLFSRISKFFLTFTFLLLPFAFPISVSAQSSPVLTRANDTFLLDGEPISYFGLRAANVLQDDQITQDFIDHMDIMKDHGIQSFALSLQGGRYTEGGNSNMNAYNSDGSLKPEYIARLQAILNASVDKNMAPVVMYFYRGRDQELVNEAAVLKAIDDTTNFLKPWRNVWLHVINEWYHSGYSHSILKTTSGQMQIYNRIKSLDPNRITHVSSDRGSTFSNANDGFKSDSGNKSVNGDVVVEFTRGDTYNEAGIFGNGGPYNYPGSDQDYKQRAMEDASDTYNNQGYWFWHAAWHQRADSSDWPRWDKGGTGTTSSPGVSFIWNHMQSLSDSSPPNTPTSILTPSSTPIPTQVSYHALISAFGKTGNRPEDLNDDGVVNIFDLNLWVNQQNQTPPHTNPTPTITPTPTSGTGNGTQPTVIGTGAYPAIAAD